MKRLILAVLLAALLGLPARTQAAPIPMNGSIAFVQNNNIALLHPSTGRIQQLTRDGTGYVPPRTVNFPYHAWSPDGKYLLVVKTASVPRRDNRSEMLLFDPAGHLLRSLGQLQYPADFNPGWATDAEAIAYTAWSKPSSPQNGFFHAVNSVDVTGHRSFLLGYTSQEGCGGGTGDPAMWMLWQETGFGNVATTLQWSTRTHVLLHSGSCGGGLYLVNTQTHASRLLDDQRSHLYWEEAALSANGRLAAVRNTVQGNNLVRTVVLADPQSGKVTRVVGPGELPAWSKDGSALFYVRRTPGGLLPFRDFLGNHTGSQVFRSAIWRVDGGTNRQTRLVVQDAFGFGPISPAPDNHTLIFSRVDNAWKLYRAYQAGRLTEAQAIQLRPQTSVEQLKLGIGVTTLLAGAGRPAVQP